MLSIVQLITGIIELGQASHGLQLVYLVQLKNAERYYIVWAENVNTVSFQIYFAKVGFESMPPSPG